MSTVKVQGNASGTGSITLASPNTNNNQTQTLPDVTGTSLVIDSSGNVNNTSGVVNLGSGQVYKDASGNFGLGVTPSSWGSPFSGSVMQLKYGAITGSGVSDTRIFVNSYYDGTSYKYIANGYATRYDQSSGGHYWFNAPSGTAGNAISFTQAMTLDASGNLLVGTTTAGALLTVDKTSGGTSSNKIAVYGYGSGLGYGIVFQPNTNTGATPCRFLNAAGSEVGYITTTSTNTTYSTSSDYRLKENIQPMTGALSVVQALKPCTYNWKVDGSNGQGFIAHELQEVVPDCVTGEKDAVDADGNPVYQGIDTSFLVATLTAAIQELKADLDATKAELAALKGATQ